MNQAVSNYYKETLSDLAKTKQKMPTNQKRRWKLWLIKEVAKSARSTDEDYKDNLGKRVKAKWWKVRNRYHDNHNKRRNATKRFIGHANQTDLDMILKWCRKRARQISQSKG